MIRPLVTVIAVFLFCSSSWGELDAFLKTHPPTPFSKASDIPGEAGGARNARFQGSYLLTDDLTQNDLPYSSTIRPSRELRLDLQFHSSKLFGPAQRQRNH